MAKVIEQYSAWCDEAGWQPTPDQIVYRASILLAETDRQAENRLEALKASGLGERGMDLRSSVTRAVFAARDGKAFDPRHRNVAAGGAQGARQALQPRRELLTLVGGPDTIVKRLKAFHDQCGVGVVDLGFQQTGTDHRDVMKEMELCGREVLPGIKELQGCAAQRALYASRSQTVPAWDTINRVERIPLHVCPAARLR